MLYRKLERPLETALVRTANKEQASKRSYRHVPLHSQMEPLVGGMFTTCDDEPLPNFMPLREWRKDMEPALQRCDQLTHMGRNQSGPLLRRIKNQNTQILRMQRAQLESDLKREDRELTGISRVIAELNRADMVQQKRRQQLHETSEELRELQVQLHKARATIKIGEQKLAVRAQKDEERASSYKEALQLRQHIAREQRLEAEAKLRKRQEMHNGLLAQVSEQRRAQLEQQQAKQAEHKRMLDNVVLLVAEEEQAERTAAERKQALKRDMDAFADMQRTLHAAMRPAPDVCDVSILESCQELTARSRAAAADERLQMMARREAVTSLVGQQIQQSNARRVKREELITDLLIKEHQARDEELAKKQVMAVHQRSKVAQADLLLQRHEVRIKQDMERHDDRFGKLPDDATCFNQRQDRLQDAHRARLRANCHSTNAVILAMVKDNAQQRAASRREQHQLMAEIEEVQQQRDQNIAYERHLILSQEPVPVLASLRNGVLSDAEYDRYNVPKRVRIP